ncbi:hypothetical protein, partial [Thermocrinis sp.]
PQYLTFKRRAELSSYALPRARACMSDIASYCATNEPASGTETYSSAISDPRFGNCVANYTTPGGLVRMEAREAPVCDNSGQLIAGEIVAYYLPNEQKVVCKVDIRPFRCYIE